MENAIKNAIFQQEAKKVGIVYTEIRLSNPRKPELKPLSVNAMVDTGATTLCIPEHISVQMGLEEIEKREVTVADGKSLVVPYVGPVQITFDNRNCFTGALVLGDGVLMGAVPMEDMDLIVHPTNRTVTVNPKSPNLPSAIVK